MPPGAYSTSICCPEPVSPFGSCGGAGPSESSGIFGSRRPFHCKWPVQEAATAAGLDCLQASRPRCAGQHRASSWALHLVQIVRSAGAPSGPALPGPLAGRRVDGRRDARRTRACAGAQLKSLPCPFWPCHMRARTGGKQGSVTVTPAESETLLSWRRAGQGLARDDLLAVTQPLSCFPPTWT